MHLESGYLRIKPGTQDVYFMVSHNFGWLYKLFFLLIILQGNLLSRNLNTHYLPVGLTTLEEGEVSNNTISLSSKHISRMSCAKNPEVTKV